VKIITDVLINSTRPAMPWPLLSLLQFQSNKKGKVDHVLN
jgi:hypothetical protein